jgi:hypothetical protein
MLRCVRPRTSIAVCFVASALALAACSGGSARPDAAATSTSSPAPGSTSSSPSTSTVTGYRLDGSLRLDQVQVLGSHNSYHGRPYPQVLAALYKSTPALAKTLDYAHAPLPKQFALGVRQIELDVWSDPLGGKYAKPSFPIQVGVRIPDEPAMHKPGYKVIHQADIDTNSTCLTFVLCLRSCARGPTRIRVTSRSTCTSR